MQVFLLDRLTIRSVCWRFYGLFWNFVDREGQKREVFLLRSKVLFANSLCYFNTCVFPMYFPIVSPCR